MSRSVRTDYEALQVFEKHPDADAYRVGAGFTGYAILAVEKRFTDAELAADYWMLSKPQTTTAGIRRRARFRDRFATLPHFDSEDAQ